MLCRIIKKMFAKIRDLKEHQTNMSLISWFTKSIKYTTVQYITCDKRSGLNVPRISVQYVITI